MSEDKVGYNGGHVGRYMGGHVCANVGENTGGHVGEDTGGGRRHMGGHVDGGMWVGILWRIWEDVCEDTGGHVGGHVGGSVEAIWVIIACVESLDANLTVLVGQRCSSQTRPSLKKNNCAKFNSLS